MVWCVGSLRSVVVTQVDVVIVTKFKVSAGWARPWPGPPGRTLTRWRLQRYNTENTQPAQHSTTTSHHSLCSDLGLGWVLGLSVSGASDASCVMCSS